MKNASNGKAKGGLKRKLWVLLFVGICILLGYEYFKIRYSSYELTKEIKTYWSQIAPQFELSMDKVELTLLPVPKLRMLDVFISPDKSCVTDKEIYFDEIQLFVSLKSLIFDRKFKLARINVSKVHIHKDEKKCLALEEITPLEEPTIKQQGLATKDADTQANLTKLKLVVGKDLKNKELLKELETQALNEKLFQTLNAQLLKTFTSLEHLFNIIDRSISIDQLIVDIQLKQKLELQQVELSKDGAYQLNGKYIWPKAYVAFKGIKPLKFHVELSDKIFAMNFFSRFFEGEAQGRFEIDFAKNLVFSQGRIHQIPLDKFYNIFYEFNIIDRWLDFKGFWGSVDFRYLSDFSKVKDSFVDFKNIQLEAKEGSIVVDSIRSFPLKNKEDIFEPFEVYVQKMDLKKILDIFDKTGLSGTVTRYGQIDGSIKFKNYLDIESTFSVEDMGFYFSRAGQRGAQKVRLKGKIAYLDERFSGLVENLVFDEELAKGEFSFNLDKKFSSGVGQVNFANISFNKKIQKIMSDGEFETISILKKMKIDNGIISHWDGNVGLSKLQTKNISAKSIKWFSSLKKEDIFGKIYFKDIYLKNNNFLLPWANVLALNETKVLQNVKISRIRFNFNTDMSFEKGALKKLKLSLPGGKTLIGAGYWEGTSKVFADLKLLKKKKRAQLWSIGGNLKKPYLYHRKSKRTRGKQKSSKIYLEPFDG
ncbi:MAG: hypothetical protein HOO06_04755 [Bdellovibrionaceae bacterium]|nr:hypothetical protein [Pseudobdellovibrionaceae bacterium]